MRTFAIIFAVGILLITQACAKHSVADTLQKELNEYIKDKDATIGVAVIIDRMDTIEVNGNKPFPMLSVYKFPITVALGDYLRVSNEIFPDSIILTQEDLRPDTYSPMRDKYEGQDSIPMPLYEIMAYALQQSDNNASDILLKLMGGADNAMLSLKRLGNEDVNVVSTEAEMHHNPDLCYDNSTTPIAMAKLLDSFDHEFNDAYSQKVKQLMETCETGKNRLAMPLTCTDAIIGHKTGTGFPLSDGRLMAINDVGYVHLPDGRSYSIAVFIENSGYDIPHTEAIIAEISKIVYNHLSVGLAVEDPTRWQL